MARQPYSPVRCLVELVRAEPASALATCVHRVLTCRGDTPALGSVRQVEWWEGAMAEPVRARRLTYQEGRRLLQIVRRGRPKPKAA